MMDVPEEIPKTERAPAAKHGNLIPGDGHQHTMNFLALRLTVASLPRMLLREEFV